MTTSQSNPGTAGHGGPGRRRTPVGETWPVPRLTQAAIRRHIRRLSAVDHLGPEAVVSFVDGELDARSLHRARVHLVHCGECRAEVRAQRHAAEAVHESNWAREVALPADLFQRLQRIADGCGDGPDAAATPTPQPEGVLDRVETLLRAVRRSGC